MNEFIFSSSIKTPFYLYWFIIYIIICPFSFCMSDLIYLYFQFGIEFEILFRMGRIINQMVATLWVPNKMSTSQSGCLLSCHIPLSALWWTTLQRWPLQPSSSSLDAFGFLFQLPEPNEQNTKRDTTKGRWFSRN